MIQLIEKKSYFLFGPRSTGKTTLIREQLQGKVQIIDLLDSEIRLRLLARPSDLGNLIRPEAARQGVVIDEVQKIPELLDEVHRLIEERKLRFLLTGSSARKLRQHGSGNLLGGRARLAHLFPLTYGEISADARFDLDRYLRVGGLPAIYGSEDPWEDLIAYVDVYLREEIQQEAQVRQLGNFTRFLKGAALQNGQLLNYAAVASDAGVPETTVRGYYQILQDTLLGEILEPWRESKKRKAIQTAKFYFFDPGVTHALLGMKTLERASDSYGRAFEQWVYMELKAYNSYRRLHLPIRYWRSVNGQEVDFLLGDRIAIEVKAKERISARDLAGLRALREEKRFEKFYLVSQDPLAQTIDGIECLPWKEWASKLWADEWGFG